MINFASKNEFKRANNASNVKKIFGSKLPQIKQHDDIIQDDDTLMSADEAQSNDASSIFPLGGQQTPLASSHTLYNYQKSHPINIISTIGSTLMQGSSSTSGVVADCGYGSSFNAASSSYNHKEPIESEMSGWSFERNFKNLLKFVPRIFIGETSNHFLSSPNNTPFSEVREIRAGCRRIRDERPGFSIMTSFNEDLLK